MEMKEMLKEKKKNRKEKQKKFDQNVSGCSYFKRFLPLRKIRPYHKFQFTCSQNYWVSGRCPSSGILNNRKQNVSETGSISALK
jgi:hypothetical protein